MSILFVAVEKRLFKCVYPPSLLAAILCGWGPVNKLSSVVNNLYNIQCIYVVTVVDDIPLIPKINLKKKII